MLSVSREGAEVGVGQPWEHADANAKLVLNFSLIGTVASFPFISQCVEAVALWIAPLS